MIFAEDAPALEAALHKHFVHNQVNKVNRRKEFFRLKLQDLRAVTQKMRYDVKWTLAAEAKDYCETLALEQRMREDPLFRKRWVETEETYSSRQPFEEEADESHQEDEDVNLSASSPSPAESHDVVR